MTRINRLKLTVFLTPIVFVVFQSFSTFQNSNIDYVPDSETAKKIAEIIWVRIYGEKLINSEKPFDVELRGNVWIVNGSLPDSVYGGTAHIEIQKNDCKILNVIHGK